MGIQKRLRSFGVPETEQKNHVRIGTSAAVAKDKTTFVEETKWPDFNPSKDLNFAVIGWPKTGTSFLLNVLGNHPEVTMPNTEFCTGWRREQLGKVSLGPKDTIQLGKAFFSALGDKRVTINPYRVFIYTPEQLSDKNDTRQEKFRADLQKFLRLEAPIADFNDVPPVNIPRDNRHL